MRFRSAFILMTGLAVIAAGTASPATRDGNMEARKSDRRITDILHLGYHGELLDSEKPSLWNLLTIGVKLGKGYQVDAQAQGTLGFDANETWALGDPRVGVSGPIFVERGWHLWMNANVELPLTEVSRSRRQGVAPGSFTLLDLHPASTRLGGGFEHWARIYVLSTNLPVKDVYGNFRPYLSFRLTPSWSLQARVSVDYFHIKGRGWQQIQSQDVAVEPGLTWQALPNLNVRPFASLRASRPADTKFASAGLWLTGWIP